jgi:hypothetical protein
LAVPQAKIFLSYRREDSSGQAGRLNDRLALEFGRDSIFMDVDGIPLGTDFVRRLTAEVASCDVLLAVIGPKWIDIRDEYENRRIDDPNDFVRVEIGAALNRDIPVIPILLDGTKMPRVQQLPSDLHALAVRNALDLRHASFHSDLDRLIRELRLQTDKREQSPEVHQEQQTKTPAVADQPAQPASRRQAGELSSGTAQSNDTSAPVQPQGTKGSHKRAKEIVLWGIGLVLGTVSGVGCMTALTSMGRYLTSNNHYGQEADEFGATAFLILCTILAAAIYRFVIRWPMLLAASLVAFISTSIATEIIVRFAYGNGWLLILVPLLASVFLFIRISCVKSSG